MFDVAIIGGGPAGSTCGSLLKKYNPALNVLIVEREVFPRDHIGESLLPAVCRILHEMDVWDKVEEAGFPVKIGGTYRWGPNRDLWDLEFIPGYEFRDETRPGTYEGQRASTAFQVDRSIFDEVLLDHAASLGCDVREGTRVIEVLHEGDRVNGLVLENGEKIEARYYVDASGQSGILRRAMDVEVDYPTALRNIAIWDYWQNADWAVNIGAHGTRILVLTVGYGWIWFIPIGKTRTSVGLVIPVSYYKQSGKKPAELYEQALKDEPTIQSLITKAHSEGLLQTTNDWSYIADRLVGENWFLAGDSCGFADPILSAGLTLAQTGGRTVAYSIMELDRGEIDPDWLKSTYSKGQRKRIRQHVQFADYWYSANGCFTDLKEYCSEIASHAGLTLDPNDAFRWLATGGFTYEDPASPIVGGFAIPAVKVLSERLSQTEAEWQVAKYNLFKLNLEGSHDELFPVPFEGRIYPKPCYVRDDKALPKYGMFGLIIDVLQKEDLIQAIVERLRVFFRHQPGGMPAEAGVEAALGTLEAMIAEGWVTCSIDPAFGFVNPAPDVESEIIHANRDIKVVEPV